MLSFTARKPLEENEPFVEGGFLLITTGTFQKRSFIAGDKRKAMLLESLDFNSFKWQWRIVAFVILDNHYHIVFQTPQGDDSRLAHIIQSAHSYSAHHWRQEDPTIRTRIWWNFWESRILTLDSLIQHINYLHRNPQFHHRTNDPAGYPFSSYGDYLKANPELIRRWETEHPAANLDIIDTF